MGNKSVEPQLTVFTVEPSLKFECWCARSNEEEKYLVESHTFTVKDSLTVSTSPPLRIQGKTSSQFNRCYENLIHKVEVPMHILFTRVIVPLGQVSVKWSFNRAILQLSLFLPAFLYFILTSQRGKKKNKPNHPTTKNLTQNQSTSFPSSLKLIDL